MFAPVGRGTPGHPDRDRQRHQHPQDRSDARPQRLDGRQGDQTRHVVPVQRERVLPAVPAETAEDGPVDGRMLHRRPRGGARPAAGAPNRASATACHANACGRGWPNGWVAAGRRRPSAAGRASCSPTTPPCACARRPSMFLVKSVFRVSSLIFFGFRHEECRPVVCFTGCPSCRT